MEALLFPLATCLLLALGMVGWRMRATTGFEELAAEFAAAEVQAEEAPRGPGPLVRIADRVGLRFQRGLLRVYGPQRLNALDRMLDRAGRPEAMSALDFVRRQAGLTAIGVVAGLMMAAARQPMLAVILAVALAAMLPLWLRQAAAQRQAQISRELPDFLDVLAVTVAAGLSLQSAMERVVETDDRPLSTEIRRVLDDLRLGVPRRAALSALRDRNDGSAVGSWVTAMLQAEELGAPLSGALNDIAADIRREAFQLARREAARTSPKISLVVTLVIMPAAILLIVAALVLANASTLAPLLGGWSG